ncbi:MAG: D-aminoacyl-tRNA deacylase [Lactovum sp.]
MRVVIQRVNQASVSIEGKVFNEIKQGFLLLVAVEDADTELDLDYAVKKLSQLRIFEDEQGKMNINIQDISGEILSISQFTLFADLRKGTRPSFSKAGKPDFAKKMYELFNEKLNEYVPTKSGVFGADMKISLENDGPVTVILDSITMREKKNL